MNMNHTSVGLIAWRLIRLMVHIGIGLAQVILRFGYLATEDKARIVQQWSAHLLVIFDIQVRIFGQPPSLLAPNTLIVSNHVSWLDIFALSHVTYARFVAKDEIRRWPVFGMLVARAGTLFIKRERRRDAARINEMLAQALQDGCCIAIFPEGTTSSGAHLLPFKASLFEAAIRAQAGVQPVGLRYVDAHGALTSATAYYGGISFPQSVRRLLAARHITVEIHFGEPIAAAGSTRHHIMQATRARVLHELKLANQMGPTDAAPETHDDHSSVAP